jgi:hypothetical protein
LVLLPSCSGSDPAPQPSTASSPGPVAAASAPAPPSASAAAAPAAFGAPYRCGELTCRDYESGAAALGAVLGETQPLVLAFGESHALKGTEGVTSTTARFTDELLPLMKDKASALVLELWSVDPKCERKKVAEVQKKQQAVTEKQADTNQSEFLRLGERSKALGIVPFILKPTCDDYERVKAAGDDAVIAMLEVITRNMRDKTKTMFEETGRKMPGRAVLTYGGALHNDLAPKPGREAWSFAADLDRLAPGRYVEVDLVVPEFIKDTEAWRSLPWYTAYDRQKMGSRTVLITVAPRAYALIFPASEGKATAK